MKILEHRRHAMRITPGQHLSQAGVALARKVGQALGPFEIVITSTLPRAFETAIAMGFAVQAQRKEFLPFDDKDKVNAAIDYPAPFARWAQQMRADKHVANYVRGQRALLHELVAQLDEGGRALIVSHGGVVEAGAVGCLPLLDWATAGEAVNYCEGVRLHFENDLCIAVDVLRI